MKMWDLHRVCTRGVPREEYIKEQSNLFYQYGISLVLVIVYMNKTREMYRRTDTEGERKNKQANKA